VSHQLAIEDRAIEPDLRNIRGQLHDVQIEHRLALISCVSRARALGSLRLDRLLVDAVLGSESFRGGRCYGGSRPSTMWTPVGDVPSLGQDLPCLTPCLIGVTTRRGNLERTHWR
jgi:hypothetical protein